MSGNADLIEVRYGLGWGWQQVCVPIRKLGAWLCAYPEAWRMVVCLSGCLRASMFPNMHSRAGEISGYALKGSSGFRMSTHEARHQRTPDVLSSHGCPGLRTTSGSRHPSPSSRTSRGRGGVTDVRDRGLPWGRHGQVRLPGHPGSPAGRGCPESRTTSIPHPPSPSSENTRRLEESRTSRIADYLGAGMAKSIIRDVQGP